MLEPRSACGPRPTGPAAGAAAKLAAQRYNRKPPPHRFLLCRSPFRLAPEFKTAVTAPGVLDCQRTKAEPERMDDDRDRLAFYPVCRGPGRLPPVLAQGLLSPRPISREIWTRSACAT